jgi:hypothetical protein
MRKTLVLNVRWSSITQAHRSIDRVKQLRLVTDARRALDALRKQLPIESPGASTHAVAEGDLCLVRLSLDERDVRYLAGLIRDVPEIARPLRAAYSN